MGAKEDFEAAAGTLVGRIQAGRPDSSALAALYKALTRYVLEWPRETAKGLDGHPVVVVDAVKDDTPKDRGEFPLGFYVFVDDDAGVKYAIGVDGQWYEWNGLDREFADDFARALPEELFSYTANSLHDTVHVRDSLLAAAALLRDARASAPK